MADPYNLYNLRNLLGDGWEDVVGEAIETIDDLRAQLERVTAERDQARGQRDNYCSRWLRAGFDRDTWKQVAEKGTEAIKAVAAQRDQARKEVAAMEAACVEIFADDYVVVIGSKADIEALTRSRVLDALKKARGE